MNTLSCKPRRALEEHDGRIRTSFAHHLQNMLWTWDHRSRSLYQGSNLYLLWLKRHQTPPLDSLDSFLLPQSNREITDRGRQLGFKSSLLTNLVILLFIISLLIHQSRAHRGHIQYEHLLQLFYNITKKMEKKPNSTNVFTTSLEP